MRTLALATLTLAITACGGAEPPRHPAPTPAPAAPTAEAAAEAKAEPPSMPELQLRALRSYVEAFNRHDAKAIAALYADDATVVERGETTLSGRAAIAQDYEAYFTAFPDAKTYISRSWHWGDAALFEFVEGGTNKGAHPTHAATGKRFGYIGASVLRFKPDGRIRQDTTYSDELTKEVQLGWAAASLAGMPVRAPVDVPPATDSWDVHRVSGADVGQPKLVVAKASLYSKFALHSEKEFLGALSDNVLIGAYDDPKDVSGLREAGALFKDWTSTFADGVVDATEGWSVDGYVVLLGTFAGKHVGAWGPVKPTKKPFKTHFLDIARVDKADKVERLWSYSNNYELLAQLGYGKAGK